MAFRLGTILTNVDTFVFGNVPCEYVRLNGTPSLVPVVGAVTESQWDSDNSLLPPVIRRGIDCSNANYDTAVSNAENATPPGTPILFWTDADVDNDTNVFVKVDPLTTVAEDDSLWVAEYSLIMSVFNGTVGALRFDCSGTATIDVANVVAIPDGGPLPTFVDRQVSGTANFETEVPDPGVTTRFMVKVVIRWNVTIGGDLTVSFRQNPALGGGSNNTILGGSCVKWTQIG